MSVHHDRIVLVLPFYAYIFIYAHTFVHMPEFSYVFCLVLLGTANALALSSGNRRSLSSVQVEGKIRAETIAVPLDATLPNSHSLADVDPYAGHMNHMENAKALNSKGFSTKTIT